MKLAELEFERPAHLAATEPPEARGLGRDQVRLLVSTAEGHHHSRFANLANFLAAGDLLVVNRSATLAASLPAEANLGPFVLNLSTRYGRSQEGELWLAEPRWSHARPGPLPLEAGEKIRVAGLVATLLTPYPGLPRLWFVGLEGDVTAAMQAHGAPIRYAYLRQAWGLEHYQTLFADTPGSAEMPSAARPFTARTLSCLVAKGVGVAKLTLHTGVSSLEVEAEEIERQPLFPEPFEVPTATAEAVNRTRAQGRRVVAVGTTVVRALESAWDGERVRAARGFTRRYVHPGTGVHALDGLLTGLHDPKASHLAMLYALAGPDLIRGGYAEAVREGYRWHEFGDSHLILRG